MDLRILLHSACLLLDHVLLAHEYKQQLPFFHFCVLILHTLVRPVANLMPCSLSDKPLKRKCLGWRMKKEAATKGPGNAKPLDAASFVFLLSLHSEFIINLSLAKHLSLA